MSEKMTSGEIAKKAGVSQKAIRLYDEKGLLSPKDYSEGNYRLYDKDSLLILEKIMALKKIGFSLEEIRENLKASGEKDIEDTLREQVKIMEARRYQLDKVIRLINGTLERTTGKLDWDSVAEIIQSINLDQRADEGHFDALYHTRNELDWYVKIFQYLGITEEEKVLDLGCGYAKLWRNNWTEIPVGTQIYGYDLHGTWADDFEKFIQEHKSELPDGVDIDLQFMDVEQKETWSHIEEDGKYDCIVAHYIYNVLKDYEKFIACCSESLSEKGRFSWNGVVVSTWHYIFRDMLAEINMNYGFIDKIIAEKEAAREEMIHVLKKYFRNVEPVLLKNCWHFNDAQDLYEKLLKLYPDQIKIFQKHESILKEHFASRIVKQGEFVVEIESEFWKCNKW